MIDHIDISQGRILVHLAALSLKATKSFTHGGIRFDTSAGTVSFGSLPAVPYPVELALADGAQLEFLLLGPDGKPRKQTRTGTLSAVKGTGMFRMPGKAKTAARFTAEDGWGIEVYKYRAYYNHAGMTTTGEIPAWLRASIERQRSLWNRLAWLCREARRKCSPEAADEVRAFVQKIVLPAIDALNSSLDRSPLKLKHPRKLKIDEPNVDGLYSLAGLLRHRQEEGKPVPPNLLEQVTAFAQRFQPNYSSLNEFEHNVARLAKQEADNLGLTWYEAGPTIERFLAVLKARKTLKRSWSEGWPLIKYPDSPGASNWSLTYHVGKSGVSASALDAGESVFGLRLDEAKATTETGHPQMTAVRAERKLREATITLRNQEREPMEFRFAVLEHRLIPQGAHLKQWQIAEVDGRLWLNLTLAIQRTVAEALSDDDAAAGLDIGWRRTEEGIRIGVLYEPLSGATKEVLLDFQRSPRDHSQRTPFRLDLGPTRWERRNITSLIPGWKLGDPIPGTVELRDVLSKRRSTLKDEAKSQLKAHLGDRTPVWFPKAGKRALIKLAGELAEDGVVGEIVTRFVAETDALDGFVSQYFEQSTRRVKYGYQQIAHDLLKYVQGRGIRRIVVEKGFLSQLAKQEPDRGADGYYALQNSQKYRQFAGVGTLVAILKTIARKYGIRVEEREAANTTRYCYWCGHLNPATAKRQFECAGCGREFDQDVNAAANLSHFPSVAMAASNAG